MNSGGKGKTVLPGFGRNMDAAKGMPFLHKNTISYLRIEALRLLIQPRFKLLFQLSEKVFFLTGLIGLYGCDLVLDILFGTLELSNCLQYDMLALRLLSSVLCG